MFGNAQPKSQYVGGKGESDNWRLYYLGAQAWIENQKVNTKENFIAMIFNQINIVQSDDDWWVDTTLPSICARTTLS